MCHIEKQKKANDGEETNPMRVLHAVLLFTWLSKTAQGPAKQDGQQAEEGSGRVQRDDL